MSGISAQGSVLSIASSTGSAKTISGIAPGNPSIVTSAAHGLNNGDVVVITGIVGTMATTLNGTSRVVANKTANTFALLDFDSTGLTYTSGGTATPSTYTVIGGVMSFSGFDGARGDLDTTDLASLAMEYISGLADEGKFSYECKTLNADLGQISVRAARTSGAVTGFKLVLPDAKTATFNALVKSIPTTGGVNAVLKGSVDTKITGPVTWS